MLKKSITYTNPFTDQEVTEEHYFHISKADLVRMQMESLNEPTTVDASGEKLMGFRAKLQRIVDSNDGVGVMEVVSDMIKRSYGRKDGDRFIKTAEIWAEFSSTEAYSQLFFDLCTNATLQAEFMNGIMPKGIEEEVTKLAAEAARVEQEGGAVAASTQPVATEPKPRELTQDEVLAMSAEDLQEGLASGKFQFPGTTAS